MAGRLRQVFSESANVKALRGLMIGLAALVVLAVSGYGTVIYIQLMGKVFPSGPLLMACYMGAFANVVLMLVLLVGKFVWFRPGAHEVASWIVTGVELLVAILNMMLAFELATGQSLSSLMQAWYYLAPVSPVFSMVGAITLIMTSTELRKRHQELELQEQKDQKEREFDLAMHLAEMDVKHQYLGFIKSKLTSELNAPERHAEMADHAALLVSEVLSGLSGLQSVPRLRGPQVATEQVIDEPLSADSDEWLQRANERIDQERAHRFAQPSSSSASSQSQRLVALAAAAEARGYDLSRLERLVGLTPAAAAMPQDERLSRLAEAAAGMGYSLDDLERVLGVSGALEQGGDGGFAKKK